MISDAMVCSTAGIGSGAIVLAARSSADRALSASIVKSPRRRRRSESAKDSIARRASVIAGAGYAGLSLGAALASVGYRVVAVERHPEKRRWLAWDPGAYATWL